MHTVIHHEPKVRTLSPARARPEGHRFLDPCQPGARALLGMFYFNDVSLTWSQVIGLEGLCWVMLDCTTYQTFKTAAPLAKLHLCPVHPVHRPRYAPPVAWATAQRKLAGWVF